MTELVFDEQSEYHGDIEWPTDEIPLVQRLRLEPGDTLILFYDVPIPHAEYQRMFEILSTRFPCNRVLILDRGTRLAVLGPEGGINGTESG